MVSCLNGSAPNLARNGNALSVSRNLRFCKNPLNAGEFCNSFPDEEGPYLQLVSGTCADGMFDNILPGAIFLPNTV